MNIKEFCDELKKEMDADMTSTSLDQSDEISKCNKMISHCENYIRKLKRFVIKYNFKNSAEEIEFFKKIKPEFMCQYLYHNRLQHLQIFKTLHSKASCQKKYRRELIDVAERLASHQEFYLYLISGKTLLDNFYFLRPRSEVQDILLDDRFSSLMDSTVAEINAGLLIKSHLLNLITHSSGSDVSKLTWQATKTDLIELIYALHASNVFGNATGIKNIATVLEMFIECDLGQYSRTFLEIRQRKKSVTTFLDTLKAKLIEKIQLMDD